MRALADQRCKHVLLRTHAQCKPGLRRTMHFMYSRYVHNCSVDSFFSGSIILFIMVKLEIPVFVVAVFTYMQSMRSMTYDVRKVSEPASHTLYPAFVREPDTSYRPLLDFVIRSNSVLSGATIDMYGWQYGYDCIVIGGDDSVDSVDGTDPDDPIDFTDFTDFTSFHGLLDYVFMLFALPQVVDE